jgi:hypothetical protein
MPSKTRRNKSRQTKAKKTKVAKQRGGQQLTVGELKAALNGVDDNMKVMCVSDASGYDATGASKGENEDGDDVFEIRFSD